jgi:acyl carrier protein
VAREDRPGDKRLVAYYVGDEEAGGEGLRRHLASRLPDYMVPAAYVRLDALPLTVNGKLDRAALPAPDAMADGRDYAAPRTATEAALAQIWAEVLGLDRVGVHDDFFELGGHSLLAVTVVERICREGMQADVRTLFEVRTVAGLGRILETQYTRANFEMPPNLIPPGCETITPDMLTLVTLTSEEIMRVARVSGGCANIQDVYPLAPLQEGILFHHLMNTDSDTYILSRLLHFDSRTRLDDFLHALQVVIDRHDTLRTAFHWRDLREPIQVVWRRAEIAIDMAVMEAVDVDAVQQLTALRDPRRYRMDIRKAPLLRGLIVEDKAGSWLLQVVSHHLIADQVTLDCLIKEIQAILLGRVDTLPEPHSFRQFVAYAKYGVSAAEHEAFFRKWLSDVTEPTIPFGLINVRGDGLDVEEAVRPVEPALATRTRQVARKLKVSPASLMHVAWAMVLSRATGQQNVVFGTVLSGRTQAGEGAGSTLGMFINTLPVRIGVGATSARQGVEDVQALLTQLLRHENASLALAQRCSGIAAPASLFSALLNYRHSRNAATGVSTMSQDGWDGVTVLHTEGRTNYPCVLSVDDFGTGFALTAQVSGHIAAGRVCDYVCAALEALVNALEEAPDTEIRHITGFGDGELMEGMPNTPPTVSRTTLLTTLSASDSLYYTQGYEAPRTATEQAVADIWAEVLGLDRIGIHDNFFELGGHSLMAMQVISKVRSVFRQDVPLRSMFEAPTLVALADRIDTEIQNLEEIEI